MCVRMRIIHIYKRITENQICGREYVAYFFYVHTFFLLLLINALRKNKFGGEVRVNFKDMINNKKSVSDLIHSKSFTKGYRKPLLTMLNEQIKNNGGFTPVEKSMIDRWIEHNVDYLKIKKRAKKAMKLVLGLRTHQYAPELNTLVLINGEEIRVAGCTNIEDAVKKYASIQIKKEKEQQLHNAH